MRPTDFEALEGMRVRLNDLTVAETRILDDFGEVLLSAGGRLRTPTDAADPGQDARAVAAANLNRQIVLDDGRSGTRRRPVRYLSPGGTLRAGDTLDELTGVLSFAFDRWRVQPTEPVTVRGRQLTDRRARRRRRRPARSPASTS